MVYLAYSVAIRILFWKCCRCWLSWKCCWSATAWTIHAAFVIASFFKPLNCPKTEVHVISNDPWTCNSLLPLILYQPWHACYVQETNIFLTSHKGPTQRRRHKDREDTYVGKTETKRMRIWKEGMENGMTAASIIHVERPHCIFHN